MKQFRCGRVVFSDDRPLIMGILNVTPDSFSDGGAYFTPDAAIKRAHELKAQGADIIDIGAVSTRPGAKPVSSAEELERIRPVLSGLKDSGLALSVDTTDWRVALFAAENGACMINDVSGYYNSYISSVIKGFHLGWIITHTDNVDAGSTVQRMSTVSEEVLAYFDASLEKAASMGIPEYQICVDPGFGFAKTTAENSELLGNFAWFAEFPCFAMCALSRKRFLGELTNEPDPVKRDFASVIAGTAAVVCGANIIRTHNVKMAKTMLDVLYPL